MKANSIATKIVSEMMCPQIRADAEQLAFEGKPVALRDLLAVNHPPALVERLTPWFMAEAEAFRARCGEDLAEWRRAAAMPQPARLYHVGGRMASGLKMERLRALSEAARSQDRKVAEAARQTLAHLLERMGGSHD
jgi:predicted HicB family RNase H-like nuclease